MPRSARSILRGAVLLASVSGMVAALPTAAKAPFRDLNHNGKRDAYENPALAVDKRVEDLMRRMTLEEKVALMLHGSLQAEGGRGIGMGKAYDKASAQELLARGVNSFITRIGPDPRTFAQENNAIQKLAEATRLGIPATISTDPRNHFAVTAGASSETGGFSQWPETLGMAAIGDEALVERFGKLVAAEYRAVGIQMALSPQADLYTEPRWPRGVATFGADPSTVSRLAGAYVRGFQGSAGGLVKSGVATVVKHWVGYGAEPEGFDGHNYYGRTAKLDNESFAQHVAAFDGSLAAKSAGVMPTYVIAEGVTIDGKPVPQVGAGFSKPMIEGLLRGTKKFGGIVISDWAITNTCPEQCMAPTAEKPQGFAIAMPWGVENLAEEDRYAVGANAGIDQFGGVDDPAPLLAAVKAGKVPLARVNEAARRVLRLKFDLGLFDNPYVDTDAAARVVGSKATQAEADTAQRAAQVLLENKSGLLPLSAGKKVWLSGVSADVAKAAGLIVVDSAEQADVAIVRVGTPHEMLHPNHFFGSRQHEGRLDFRADDEATKVVFNAAAKVPTIVAVDLDRPAVLTLLKDKASALYGLFGASDAVLLDLVTGKAKSKGKLPFELPSSAKAVEDQHPGRPDDSANPLYKRGDGIFLP
ncbi:glycoside hydrolase family 3 protein [Novosphingobium sp. ERN07]|uniref:glycoside hydrolase family 3 protein n=1 Tax=Novosphingobium sp. ERN07 TaxID=2726187 RepID=UPI0014568371|nr:glycoside hydrolase family 3 N-terminal domain-containing protein [Novosphingobium sp. ERN07]NLR70208.1 glycoside hydrolase family 3 protein [Novosphingobium sp. ERN07]